LLVDGDDRKVRGVLRSNVLAGFDDPAAGMLLLTDRDMAPFAGRNDNVPGEAFKFESPVTPGRLKALAGKLDSTLTPRPVVMWSAGTFDKPELVVWGTGAKASVPGKTVVERLFRGSDSSTVAHKNWI
jgi:hypothetical protein